MDIHILGAAEHEIHYAEKWGELLRLMPNVKKLNLRMFGPEVPAEMRGAGDTDCFIGKHSKNIGKHRKNIAKHSKT